MADVPEIRASLFTLPELQVGPFVLKDVSVLGYSTCQSLLGQLVLERFDAHPNDDYESWTWLSPER